HFLTYDELHRRANQLARHLQTMGVAPDRLVALYLDRSINVLVGMLAILKAGGAYVPIDPALPKKRLEMILEDSRASVIVTSQRLATAVCEYGQQVVRLDADWPLISEQSDRNPVSQITVENLVYVIFTSGSTGRPKGVAIEHRQLVNYVQGIINK